VQSFHTAIPKVVTNEMKDSWIAFQVFKLKTPSARGIKVIALMRMKIRIGTKIFLIFDFLRAAKL